jgi:hypothetical protein
MLAGGRSDQHERAWSFPPLPDDGGGLQPGPGRPGRAAGVPALVDLDDRHVVGYEALARDLGDDGPDGRRRYDVVVTHDRDLVIRAAAPLLRRLVPER